MLGTKQLASESTGGTEALRDHLANEIVFNSVSFSSLADDVHHTIFTFLSYNEKIKTISSNTSLYRLYLKKERIIQLKDKNVLNFFHDLSFQQLILEKIVSPLDQLIIHDKDSLYHPLMNGGHDLVVPQLNGVRALDLPIDIYVMLNELFPDFIPVVQNLHLRPSYGSHNDLHLLNSNYDKEMESERILPFLHRAKKSIKFYSLKDLTEELSLSPTIEELSFEYCNVIKKLASPLPNLRVVKLDETIIRNLHDFSHLQQLSLDEPVISEMTNYTALNKAKRLILRECEETEDFTFLQETEEVNIFSFFGIMDYSKCFKKSKKIHIKDDFPATDIDVDLSYYSQVEEFTLTGEKLVLTNGLATGRISSTLKRLHLANVCGIKNLSGFDHLTKISLLNCPNITTLIGLTHVPSIHLYGLVVTSLEGLGENRDVWIESCDNITDFSPLKYVNRVTVANCKGFRDASHLDQVAHVTITSCDGLEDVSGFRNAESVELLVCPLVKSVGALKDVKKMKVYKCKLLNCSLPSFFLLREIVLTQLPIN